MSDAVTRMSVINDLDLAWYDLNDLGNAQRLQARFGDVLQYVPGTGWVGWNGQHWDMAAGEAFASRFAHQTAALIRQEARALMEALGDSGSALAKKVAAGTMTRDMVEERADALHRFSVDSGNGGRTRAMLTQAESYLRAPLDSFDRDQHLLCVANGVLRVGPREAGDGVPVVFTPHHDPALRMSRITASAYEPHASCQQWMKLIADSLPVEAERDYFQLWMGYMLFGGNPEQRLLILQGPGKDGKSTVINIIREVLGLYASSCDVQTFLEDARRSGAQASPDLARLAGDVRLVSASEPNRGAKFNEGIIKQITGGAPMTVRKLNEDPFEYAPRFKPVIEVNSKPVIGGTDDGIWRRIDLILFRHQVADDQVNLHLVREIVEREAAGVLAWLVKGLQEWHAGGLRRPDSVREAVEEYRISSVPFTAWFRERLEPDAGARVGATELYKDYEDWCRANDQNAMNRNSFGRVLTDRQIRRQKNRDGKNEYRGLRLLPRTADMDAALHDEMLHDDRKGRR